MLRVKNVFSDPPRSSDSDCNSINQPCAQDNWYTQTVGTLQNGGAFGPLKGNVTSCSDAPCKLSDANLGNPDSVCPTGYVFDKSALDKSKFCTLVSGAYSVGKPCPGCNPVCFLQLRNACRPQVPNLDGSDLAQCCSGSQLQCPAPQYPFCCPPTYCINNNTCGPFMSDWCIKTGFVPGRNSPCEQYLRNSSNADMKMMVTRNWINDQLTKNNTTLQNQPNIKSIAEICRIAPPGTCDSIMQQQCQIYSRDEIEADPSLATLCGCFMRPSNYDKYKNIITQNGKLYPQCDPACMNAYAVQPGSNCKYQPCNS